jgi:hypothetical protein
MKALLLLWRRQRRLERDLDEELSFHLTMREAERLDDVLTLGTH